MACRHTMTLLCIKSVGGPVSYYNTNSSRFSGLVPQSSQELTTMVSITFFLTTLLAVAGVASAKPVAKSTKQPVVTYLGTQGPILSSGAWTSKGIVYTSGTVPTFNGSIITGGIEEQTVRSRPLSTFSRISDVSACILRRV